ncbi:hypothetical protein C0416_04515 [bacterium]|nr:hypothetical protein [bacterium]
MVILGIALIFFMFVFGSYMNAGYADLVQTSGNSFVASGMSTKGLAFDKDEDISLFASGNPDVVILLSSINTSYEASGVLTVNPDLTKAFNQKDLYRKHILELIKLDYVDDYEEAFLYNQDFSNLVGKVKNVYPSARIVPLVFQQNYEKGDPYKLSRKLVSLVENERGKVLIVADFNKIESTHESINELRNTMLERALTNIEITSVSNLAVDEYAGLKTLMYSMHLLGARDTEVTSNYTIFKQGEIKNKSQAITLLGVGDMMLGRYVRTLMDKNGMNYPFEKITHELNGIDYIFSNFEGPIKEQEVATQKSISFRFKPDVVWVVKNAGINIVSIANNHALDQGWGGRDDTMKFLKEAGIYYFGHPKNEAEENVYIGQIADKTVAFVGFDDTIFKVDEESAKKMIQELDIVADYVVVSIHWGVEYVHQPTERSQMLAHMFVDSGADIVIGHHPHVVQTMEIYNETPIFYSLGNFVFDQYFSQDTQEGLGIGVIVEGEELKVYLLPYAISASQPALMEGDAKTAFLEKFISWGNYDEDMKNSIRNGVFVLPQNP